MKLGIDISQIAYRGTGVGRFTEGLVNAILDYDKKNKWTFLFSGLRQKLPSDIKTKICAKSHILLEVSIPPRVLSFLWNDMHSISQHFLFSLGQLNDLDWFITSDWTEPPLSTHKATIVHDLVFKKYPETVHPTILRTQELRLKWITKESNVIFTDSESTAEDLKHYYDIDKKKIHVNYPGVETTTGRTTEDIISKYRLKDSFILTVGKLEPRKNIDKLIEAYLSLEIKKKPDLVIVGIEGWNTEKYLNESIKYLGFVPDGDLTALYQKALFFVLPSIYEGFGYPVIEAMKQGCPVATSNTSSLAEIADGNALLFDPHEVTSIEKALKKMTENKVLREDLSKKGKKKSAYFTWERYYNNMVKTLSINMKHKT